VRRDGLRAEQGAQSEALLPGRQGPVGVMAQDHRRCVEAVIARDRAGIPGRDLPERCGDTRIDCNYSFTLTRPTRP
jgi:hypothetical protein